MKPAYDVDPLPTDYPPGSVVCCACDSVVNAFLEYVPGKKPNGRSCSHRKTRRRFVALVAVAFLLLTGCGLQLPPVEGPPVTECAHVWSNDEGVEYRLPTTSVHVLNTSGYPLDLSSLGGDVMQFSADSGDFKVPMTRVNLPGNGWLGIARVWVNNRSGGITRAEVQMNEGYSIMSERPVATHVGCMEVLHTSALGHQKGQSSCMNDCSGASDWKACMRDPAKATPDPHDLEQLAAIYATDIKPPSVCVQGEVTLLTFTFPAPGEGDAHHGHE